MDATRAYDFRGTHLKIYCGLAGQVTDDVYVERQMVAAFGPGLALAQPLVAPFEMDGEHVADIEIGIAQSRPACVAVRGAHGQPLTGALLRSLALASLVTDVAVPHTYRVFRTSRGRYIGAYYSDAFEGMLGFEDDLAELRADVTSERHRRTLDDAFLSEVSAAYQDAVARRLPRGKFVQEKFGPTTPENARRWIALARKRGLLDAWNPSPRKGGTDA